LKEGSACKGFYYEAILVKVAVGGDSVGSLSSKGYLRRFFWIACLKGKEAGGTLDPFNVEDFLVSFYFPLYAIGVDIFRM
jgi:hypothetical protein